MASKMSKTAAPSPDRRERVRAAALQVFARYGLRRATMADIAAAAGISRPALYLVHPNKTAVVRDLAEHLVGESVAAAEAAWPEAMAVGDGLTAAILARDLPLFRILAASAHGAEILADAAAMTQDLHAAIEARFRALVTQRLAAAGVAEAEATARMIAKAADGLKHAGGLEADYIADVRRLADAVGARQPGAELTPRR